MLISIISACRLLAPQENLVLAVNWHQHFTAYIRELEIYRYNSAVGGLSDAIHQDNRMAGIQFNLPCSMQNTLQSNFRKCPNRSYQMNPFLGRFLSQTLSTRQNPKLHPSSAVSVHGLLHSLNILVWMSCVYLSGKRILLKFISSWTISTNLISALGLLFVYTHITRFKSQHLLLCSTVYPGCQLSVLVEMSLSARQGQNSSVRDGKEEFISSRQSLFPRINSTTNSHVERGIVHLILCRSQMTVDIQPVHLKCRVSSSPQR